MPTFATRNAWLQSPYTLILLSLGLHIVLLTTLSPSGAFKKEQKDFAPVEIKVVEKSVKKEEPPAPLPPPDVKPEKVKLKTPPLPATSETANPKADAKPTFGLNPKSFDNSKTADGPSVPAGNTIAMPDDGKRITPEEVQALAKDLSSDAEMIASSFIKPEYTAEAETAELEGSFAIEVFVDKNGDVKDVEIEKKVGYGMDAKLIEAAKQAKFKPRKDQRGQAIEGWTRIKVRLTLN